MKRFIDISVRPATMQRKSSGKPGRAKAEAISHSKRLPFVSQP